MPADFYREILNLAAEIRDCYLRTVTYAKIGYYLHKARRNEYKEAFKYALSAASSIENPVLMTKALMEIGTYLNGINEETSKKVFQQVYETIGMFPQPLKDGLMAELSNRLIELGRLDDALFYASDIEDKVKRNDVLLKILGGYLKRGNMRKARLIIENVGDEPWHSIAAVEAVKEHLKREEFGSAIRVLKEIRSDYWLGEAMKEVAVHLKNADVPRATYEKFVDIALSLSNETGSDVLRSLLVGLGSQGELEFVMEIASKLPEEERKGVFKGIVSAVVDSPEVLKKLAEVVGEETFDWIAGVIMDKLLSRPPGKEYSELVKLIGQRTKNDAVLVKVATYLSKIGDFDGAWEFASNVRSHYLRSLAFGSIAVAKLKAGDVSGAIDAATEVKDPRWGSWLLSEILTKVLELKTNGSIVEDLNERAESQRAIWEKD